MITQARSKRKYTGKKYLKYKKKKLYEKGSNPTHTKLGPTKRKVERVKFGNYKVRLLNDEFVNVAVDGTVKKVKILNVIENQADKQLVRQNVITKGAIVKTELGLVKITSRPGQVGVINGVLIKKE
ncbi:MAG: 30S ribosomal protein S8e [Candidatus Woesearchaeota archaeon]